MPQRPVVVYLRRQRNPEAQAIVRKDGCHAGAEMRLALPKLLLLRKLLRPPLEHRTPATRPARRIVLFAGISEWSELLNLRGEQLTSIEGHRLHV